MTTRSGEIPKMRCACGSKLRWETRQTTFGTRVLALCANPECGQITTSANTSESDGGLRWFLLGDGPVQRYLPPWVRFYFRAQEAGFLFHAHHDDCWDCASHATVALDLPPARRPNGLGNGLRLALCHACGATAVGFFFGGDYTNHMLDGEAWMEPAAPIVSLRRALATRAAPDDLNPDLP